jgi:siroheme synthase-like protein
MPYFPLFVNLAGTACTLVGGGPVAERRARTLIDFGVSLTVIAPQPSETIRAWAGDGALTLETREYAGAEDLRNAGLVIAAANDRELNRRVAADAQRAGILVNAADDPAACGFFFPALVRRGELVAGITSSGSCPGLTSRLREELDKSWPPSLGESAAALAGERRRLRKEARGKGASSGEGGTAWREGLNRLIRLAAAENQAT